VSSSLPERRGATDRRLFSVIVATRDRTSLFETALASVNAQRFRAFELIVVDDGSNEENTSRIREQLANIAEIPTIFHALRRRPKGHGASLARNLGAELASGDYLCFLDDDDEWTDPDYLGRVARTIEETGGKLDLHLSNQVAFRGQERMPAPIWIEDLAATLATSSSRTDAQGAHAVSARELLRTDRFCHLNTLIVRRALFLDLEGFDESIRWEHDRDFYWRVIERADNIAYSPRFVARHNVADRGRPSVRTGMSEVERRLDQLRVFDKAILFSGHPTIRAHGRRHRGYTLKRIAETCAADKKRHAAAHYARAALAALPTAKWATYTALLSLAALRRVQNA
jgi:glycosyltransferase involved in cell wall biosynthesis